MQKALECVDLIHSADASREVFRRIVGMQSLQHSHRYFDLFRMPFAETDDAGNDRVRAYIF